MERVKGLLLSIREQPEAAEALLEGALRERRDETVGGLAAYLKAALEGFWPDPDSL